MTPTDLLDCDAPGNKDCFVPRYSKTDNFKVRVGAIIEIDTRFSRNGVPGLIDGLGVTWVDPLGAGNVKWSEYNPAVLAFHEAHVEAAEPGVHRIVVTDQPGCVIDDAHGPDGTTYLPTDGRSSEPRQTALRGEAAPPRPAP
ncbi:MAG TPA: hypothetical protein VIU11_26850 [Nakamurella sp.]